MLKIVRSGAKKEGQREEERQPNFLPEPVGALYRTCVRQISAVSRTVAPIARRGDGPDRPAS